MSIGQQIECDLPGCKRVRSETNHWWAVHVSDGKSISIYWWDYAAQSPAAVAQTKHFCGQAHALQYVSASMGGQGTPQA
jgi:hypothetical protein